MNKCRKIRERLNYFPRLLAEGSQNPPQTSSAAAAALISTGIGCFLMMVGHHLLHSDSTQVIEKIVQTLGSWIPGSHSKSKIWGNIGSYAGEETILLIGWLTSWIILHLFGQNKNIKAQTIIFWLFVLMIAATTMIWRPLFPYLPLT